MITGFLPPLLMIMPIVFSYTLGPLSWYPLRALLNISSLVSLAFFYDSFLRRLPLLVYLTAFDKYIYCLYIWCCLSLITLIMLVYAFSDAQDLHQHTPESAREGLLDETPLLLTVDLRDDLLHFSMFAALVTLFAVLAVFLLWLVTPNALILLVIMMGLVFYFWWAHASHHRIKRKHGLEQEQDGHYHVHRKAASNTEAAKGRQFNWELLLCCCYGPIVAMCLEECCCCCPCVKKMYDEDDQIVDKDRDVKDDNKDFPPQFYAAKGAGGVCAICKKAGYKECIFGGRHSVGSTTAGSQASAEAAPGAAAQPTLTPAEAVTSAPVAPAAMKDSEEAAEL